MLRSISEVCTIAPDCSVIINMCHYTFKKVAINGSEILTPDYNGGEITSKLLATLEVNSRTCNASGLVTYSGLLYFPEDKNLEALPISNQSLASIVKAVNSALASADGSIADA